jgi:hypothetical protein
MKAARSAAFIYLGFCPSYLKKQIKTQNQSGGAKRRPVDFGFYVLSEPCYYYIFLLETYP